MCQVGQAVAAAAAAAQLRSALLVPRQDDFAEDELNRGDRRDRDEGADHPEEDDPKWGSAVAAADVQLSTDPELLQHHRERPPHPTPLVGDDRVDSSRRFRRVRTSVDR